MSDVDPATSKWHIDKRIPVTMIIALAIQSAAVAFYGGQVSERIDNIEEKQVAASPNANRITTLETHLIYIAEDIKDIKEEFKRVSERLGESPNER